MNESINLKLPEFPDLKLYTEIGNYTSFWDSKELDHLNETLIATVLKIREVNDRISMYEKRKIKAELDYKHSLRLALLETEAKTEAQKRQLAELSCEKKEIKVAYLDEVIKELTRESYSLRTELDVLKTLGHNIRQELRL